MDLSVVINCLSLATLVLLREVTLTTIKGTISSRNGAPITFNEFLRVLRKMPIQYSFELGTLVAGDELYRLEADLNPDCRATIMAYTRMMFNWTSYPDVYFGLTLNNLADSELKHPFESVCLLVEDQLSETSKAGDFVRLKEEMKTTTTAIKPHHYFDKLLETGEDIEAVTNKILRIPGIAKMLTIEEFRKQKHSQTAYTNETYILAKSIQAVADKGKYKAQIQSIYDQVAEETAAMLPQLTSMRDLVLKGSRTLFFTPPMMQFLQKRLDEDSDLKWELQNAKKLVQATF